MCRVDKWDFEVVWGFLNGLDDGETTPGLEGYRGMGEGEEGGIRSGREEGKRGLELDLVGEEGTWGEKAKGMPFGDRAFFPIECVKTSRNAHFRQSKRRRTLELTDASFSFLRSFVWLGWDRSEHFNPPLSSEDRLKQMMLPLLKNLGRGGARKVDLVEVGVGGKSRFLSVQGVGRRSRSAL